VTQAQVSFVAVKISPCETMTLKVCSKTGSSRQNTTYWLPTEWTEE